MTHHHNPPLQRITITIDISDEPSNHTIAVSALLDIVRHLELDATNPTHIRLDIAPAPTT